MQKSKVKIMIQDTNTHAQEQIDLKTIINESSNNLVLICFLLSPSIIKNLMNLCTNYYRKFQTEPTNEATEAWFSRV